MGLILAIMIALQGTLCVMYAVAQHNLSAVKKSNTFLRDEYRVLKIKTDKMEKAVYENDTNELFCIKKRYAIKHDMEAAMWNGINQS